MTTRTYEAPGAATVEPLRTPLALRVRRYALVASPVLAGLLCLAASIADPAAGVSGSAMYEEYAAKPEPLQYKSLAFHWGYAFWIAPALLVLRYVRGRGAWLANAAAVLAFAGMTTLPGLLFVDFYDSAIGQLYGAEGAEAVSARMEQMWGVTAFGAPGLVGFVVALPLSALALWRAGLVRWWAPLAVLAGFGAFMLSNVTWWGCALLTLCFTAYAVALEGATRPRPR